MLVVLLHVSEAETRNGKPKCSYESQMCAERGSDEECKIVIMTAKGL